MNNYRQHKDDSLPWLQWDILNVAANWADVHIITVRTCWLSCYSDYNIPAERVFLEP
jgi:hypothetical protein